jgi:hypothetical protein
MFNELNMIGVVAYMKITMIPINFLIRVRSKVLTEYNLYIETNVSIAKSTSKDICQRFESKPRKINGMKINVIRAISIR